MQISFELDDVDEASTIHRLQQSAKAALREIPAQAKFYLLQGLDTYKELTPKTFTKTVTDVTVKTTEKPVRMPPAKTMDKPIEVNHG